MARYLGNHHWAIKGGLIALLSLLIPACGRTFPASSGDEHNGFVGDAACVSCHGNIVRTYEKTSHRNTLQAATRASILGPLESPRNHIRTVDPKTSPLGDSLDFYLHADGDKFLQTAILAEYQDLTGGFSKREVTRAMDLVVGSGTRGQSYLSWEGGVLRQLPVSYWTSTKQWINSPGYPDGSAIFDRVASPRCLECHTTFLAVVQVPGQMEHYDPASLVRGITCERCHGPGAQHVRAKQNPAAESRDQGEPMVNPSRLSRERQVDLCGLCHNGAGRSPTQPAFSFQAGDELRKFFREMPAELVKPEVHGDQVGLLKRSRCYRESTNMTCSTCHDEHQREHPAEAYSARCLTCHSVNACRTALAATKHGQQADCVSCHMPLRDTGAIVSTTAGVSTRAQMRTHWIKAYAAEPNEPL